ncbi:ATPase inhibitor mai-2, mitochondrial-like [Saccoglossus kowalevskii]|uniref:ATPase inhibitor, mitochondrial-like n=1 Tax=Saccoglossus kowalevskii TaxID=10224 RepID=A0ABM0GRK6_SACKO|nr:PREDICTED: ATPase inhibitor, mitochondrial-like [Saccoglossus kowalevskii]
MAALIQHAARRLSRNVATFRHACACMYSTGEMGSGAGKGGGGGGSIREAGGAFGQMEAAREEQYFRRLQEKQLKSLKSAHDEEIFFHEQAIKRHQDAIARHKRKQASIQEDESDLKS